MALTPKLEIRQSPSLTLTPQLRQAINLLQMNNLELNEFVAQELNSNPLLEREEDYLNDSDETSLEDIGQEAQSEEEFTPDFDEGAQFDDAGSDSEGYNTSDDVSLQDYHKQKSNRDSDDGYDFFSERLAAVTSLYDVIKGQIDLQFTNPRDKLVAFILWEHLDASGYFYANLEQIAQKLKTSLPYLQQILDKLKTFEPSGIFAQSLKECLTIQADDKGLLNKPMQLLLDNLELLGAQKFKELSNICACPQEDLMTLIKQIKSLNPKPAAGYDVTPNSYIIPDVILHRNKQGEYTVELNAGTLPKLLINQRYYAELGKDKTAARYLKSQLSQASFLIKALHSRATSILRISEEIVLRQYHFFEKGIEYLKPMTLKDIAEALELSESTISRVTTGKYISAPSGIFELKYFFSAAAGNYLGNDDVSTTTIKHKIKKLIENEDPKHILSDEKLVELLENDGTKIARRTVAKYREAMGIATSAERKRLKRRK